MRRLEDLQIALGREMQAGIQQPVRRGDIVVGDNQPVIGVQVAPLQRRVDVIEFSALSHPDGGELHLVA